MYFILLPPPLSYQTINYVETKIRSVICIRNDWKLFNNAILYSDNF